MPASSETEYFIHPSSMIDEPCQIGAGTRIWHFCHIHKRTPFPGVARVSNPSIISVGTGWKPVLHKNTVFSARKRTSRNSI